MKNETAPIPLPPKTREMLRNLVAERATLQALEAALAAAQADEIDFNAVIP